MSIIIFILILSALIIVHELGHFLVARFFGIRVEEFGLGFPPRVKTLFVWKDTPFTLNWLPFGGFIKIFGENLNTTEEISSSDSFQAKNRGIQAVVLVAGVVGNFFFAWSLLSIGFLAGLPAPSDLSLPVTDTHTVITTILPNTPADKAGLKSGDIIASLSRGGIYAEPSPGSLSEFIANSKEPISFEIDRGGTIYTKVVIPQENIVADRLAVGISMDTVGTVQLPFHQAVWQGLKMTSELTWLTARGIGTLILQAVSGKANLASVTGPVGIVSMVGEVRTLGFIYLLTFTALISINLSIINLLPLPALDGGRLFFVIIEAVTRRKIPAFVSNLLNTTGFALLVLLMVLITIQDIRNIF